MISGFQNKLPYRIGAGGGSTATAGGLVFHGEPDGNFVAYDAKTGEVLWRFQTGFGADAPPVFYEIDGEEYVAIATGGNLMSGSAYGDAIWTFSLGGHFDPLWPPPPPPTVAGPAGPIADGVNTIKIGDNNVEYAFFPSRTKIKARTTVTFTNVGDVTHTATAFQNGDWDTGGARQGPVETDHLQRAGNILLHLHPAPLDVRADYRRAVKPTAQP
jgi:outer membrane protein assembly factor BamB